MKIIKYIIPILIIFFFFSCTPATRVPEVKKVKKEKKIVKRIIKKKKKIIIPQTKIEKKVPDIRIGLAEKKKTIFFKINGKYSILNSMGKVIFNDKKYYHQLKVTIKNKNILVTDFVSKQKIELRDKIIFKPRNNDNSIVIYKNKRKQLGSYRGNIEFINIKNRITIVNELPLNYYLYGVVPSEMHSKSPMEALKAQAILARTVVFSKIGHKYRNKPYQLSNNVYSQVYKGKFQEGRRSSLAVDKTKGIILTYKGKPIEAVFSSCCGGFLEDASAVWSGLGKPYLKAHADISYIVNKYKNLSNENVFRSWINSRPNAYCNFDKRNFPKELSYGKKYFRWTKKYSRKSLQKIIKRKTGKDIGSLKNIIVLKRGKSGKARVIKIVGSKKNVNISKELNIRKKLAKGYLYSANFYVERKGINRYGVPREFIFHGAGFGHGVGMCQLGAVGMALDGKSCNKILKFYFPNTKFKNILKW